MKNQLTIMFSSVRSTAILLISLTSLLACKQKAWEGKFMAQNSCSVLEFIKVYPDNTADVKYKALKDEANFESTFTQEDSILYIRELNREWAFKLSHDTLFEISNQDPLCFLVKEQ